MAVLCTADLQAIPQQGIKVVWRGARNALRHRMQPLQNWLEGVRADHEGRRGGYHRQNSGDGSSFCHLPRAPSTTHVVAQSRAGLAARRCARSGVSGLKPSAARRLCMHMLYWRRYEASGSQHHKTHKTTYPLMLAATNSTRPLLNA